MAKPKKFNDRVNDEKAEGYDTVKTDLPSDRFQESKQVLGPDELGVTKSSIPGSEKAVTTSNMAAPVAKAVKSKMKIRPDVSVEELKNKQVGGVPLAANPGLRSVAGVSNQSAADDQSKIPYTKGDYRPGTRYGKKRSEDLFEMDNTISEQLAPVVDDAKDLRDAPDAKQGYNGRKQFTQTRGKKNANFKFKLNNVDVNNGKIPQQLLQENSLDFVSTSKKIFTTGQVIEGVDAQADYPTIKAAGTNTSAVTDVMHKGNYMPTSLNITVSGGKITAVSISEHRVKVQADPVTRDQSNMNWQTDAHNVAKSMVRMQSELGRETSENWSPLGYVITEPYQYNMLLHDIEATTGAIMATAYRAAVSSMAFQRNILAKDGVNPQRNAVKMIIEGYAGKLKNSTAAVLNDTDFGHVIWNKGAYRDGSVAAMIAMFDSTGKYQTKADLLGLQRSLGLHLSQADNNLNPLHCKPEFIKVLDKAHMFSTIDGNYNPMLPIFTTRKINIFNPLSLNVFLVGWKNPSTLTADEIADPLRDATTGTYANYAYRYKDRMNYYTQRIQHPIVEGILRWLLKHEGAFCEKYGNGNVVIPFEFNFEAPNMLSFLLCSASQDVLWERNIIFKDVLFAGEKMSYIWDDLQGLDKLNPLYSSQLTIGKYDQPLKLGRLAVDTAIRELWPGHMCLSDTQSGVGVDAKVQYFAPWYMNEAAYTNSYTANEGFNAEERAFNMTIPSIRDGVRHEYVDLIKGVEERDIRLALDRWTRFPLFDTAQNVTSQSTGNPLLWIEHDMVTTSTDINKYIKVSAVRYEFNSDGRIALTYQLEDGTTENNLNEFSLYGCPKELGFIEDSYDTEAVVTAINYSDDAHDPVTVTNLYPYNTYDGAQGYNGKAPVILTSYRVEADSDTSQSIDRSAALYQVCYNCFACEDANAINVEYINKIGIIPCFSYNNNAPLSLYGHFTLNGSTQAAAPIDKMITSHAQTTWSMLQRCFFPVNRFENCYTFDNSKTAYDPLEATFFFGVCGTLASDFTQDVLERLDVYDQLGLDYTEDVFVKDSLLFR